MNTAKKIEAALAADDRKEACRLFCDVDCDDEYETLARKFPGLRNYDRKGNWVGSVANENGWTP